MTISKSVVRSKVAAAKAGQEYARALLQYQNMQNQKKRLEELQADTQNQLEIHAKQVDLFYDGLITIKTFVVLCLRSYADSYRFFSLQESAIVLDMQKSPVDLTRVSDIYFEFDLVSIPVLRAHVLGFCDAQARDGVLFVSAQQRSAALLYYHYLHQLRRGSYEKRPAIYCRL